MNCDLPTQELCTQQLLHDCWRHTLETTLTLPKEERDYRSFNSSMVLTQTEEDSNASAEYRFRCYGRHIQKLQHVPTVSRIQDARYISTSTSTNTLCPKKGTSAWKRKSSAKPNWQILHNANVFFSFTCFGICPFHDITNTVPLNKDDTRKAWQTNNSQRIIFQQYPSETSKGLPSQLGPEILGEQGLEFA